MMSSFLRAGLTVLALLSSVQAQSVDGGKTVIVGGITYYAAPEVVSIIDATQDQLRRALTTGQDLIPLTVIADSSSAFTVEAFRATVANYTKIDDVFNQGFLQCMYTHHSSKPQLTLPSCLLEARRPQPSYS